MPARDPLPEAALQAAIARLDGWRPEADGDGNRIVRDFTFADFREAFAFLTRVAFEAEALDHHPEITNVYHRVRLALNTHDAGGRVTETDLALAARIDALAGA